MKKRNINVKDCIKVKSQRCPEVTIPLDFKRSAEENY